MSQRQQPARSACASQVGKQRSNQWRNTVTNSGRLNPFFLAFLFPIANDKAQREAL